ncbi:MAG TPA: sugar phosphate nucleotidyltransferase [Chloroflexota bacterium]|jgi:glucose-1-phosphate thymidylyltransferase
MSGLQVVVPLAGLGTRLRPHTHTRPKPLLNVAGKPILGHIVDQLASAPVDEVIFITGHLGDQIERWAAEQCPYPSRFVEQRELRGQAHAISLVGDRLDRPTLIVFADTIFEADLSQLGRGDEDGVLFVQEVDDPRRFGIAQVGSDGEVQRLVEKPKEPVGNLAVVGIYYLRDPRWLMRAIDRVIARDQQIGGEFYLADALQTMIDGGARFRVGPTPVWADCGTVDALLSTNRFLLANGRARAPAPSGDSAIIPPVNIDPSAVIERSVIGPNVSIAAGATVADSIVADSIVNELARIEGATLTGSLVGSRAVVLGQRARLNVGDDSQVSLG